MADMKLFLELLLKNSGFKTGLGDSGRAVSGFTKTARREFDGLRQSVQSVKGVMAGLGLSYGFVQMQAASARLDKGLTQVRQTAGETAAMAKGLREEFFRMGSDTGNQVETLKDGFDSLIQSGLSWRASLESTKGINIATAVTSVDPKRLADALSIASNQYEIDLEKPGKSLELLDKMVVAGRLGNAEITSLADSFSRFSNNATRAGFSFEKTLAFAEALSYAEKNPERLGTLVDSTLRVFTNMKYMGEAQGASGIKFFDVKGGRRDPIAVLSDIQKKYAQLKTDAQRANFMQAAFGKMDLDTQKGMDTVLKKAAIPRINEFTQKIEDAGGTLKRDLPDAIDNAADQTARLKAELRNAADAFAQPINKALVAGAKYLLDQRKLSGKEMIGIGSAALLTAAIAKRFGPKMLKGLIGGVAGTAEGVVMGKALEQAAGVTPVFVTNWPATLGGVVPDIPAGSIPRTIVSKGKGILPFLGKMSVPALGAFGSWHLGSWMDKKLGGSGAYYDEGMFPGGAGPRREPKTEIKLDLQIDGQGRVFARSNDMATSIDVGSRRGSFFGALMTTEGM